MLLELGVPQGLVVSRWGGGEEVLDRVMESARSEALTGYLKVVLSAGGERSESLVSLSAGVPSVCMHVYRPAGVDEIWFLGDVAAEYLWYDASRPEASLSMHAEVDLKDYENLFPGARVRRVEAPPNPLPAERVRAEKLRRAEPENTGEHLLAAAGLETGERSERQAQGVYDLILQYHKMRSTVQRAGVCDDCGGPVDLLGYCPRCASREDGPGVPRMEPRHSFDTFVSGRGTRFAEAAARAVSADPGHRYNPLVIHARAGMGKTHLLQAIGRELRKGRGEMNVTYLPLDAVDLSAGDASAAALRQELEAADALLLDDVQFLSGKDRLQEEMLRAINRLVASTKQVVVTADRSPRDIPSLTDRLVSRLESGLVVDMGPPDLEARRELLRREAAERRAEVPPEVLDLLAETCRESPRQLEGGMNRVLAFASLMGARVDLDLAREVMGTPSTEKEEVRVVDGRSYLVEEPRPEHAYRLLASHIDQGARALVFSRSNPASVRERLQGRKAEIIWLTEHETKGVRTLPPTLEKIVMLSEDHIRKEGASIVMLDDLHYLISNATFDGVIRFVRSLVDQVSERRAVFMVSVSPDSLKVQERSVLERELEPVRP
ncbi:MAG: DUF835 domain-containing protein [Methanomassiliicoccus sp.]|nr:DUF835 domain-containing protein [Methanomassiliicoccus sp.]